MIIVWQTAGLCTTIKTWNCCFRKYFKRLDGKQAKRFLWQIDLFSIYMTLKTRKLTLRNFSAVCMLTFPLIPIFLALYGLHLFLTILLFCFYFSLDYKNFCISILADFFFFLLFITHLRKISPAWCPRCLCLSDIHSVYDYNSLINALPQCVYVILAVTSSVMG